ncbi:MAG: CRISPR-associated RAMP protein Csx7 [Desulfobacteraceae bacterium]|jgi:CRISPR-associated protein Csm3|nr:CRISPR-associated RAMP protein Csx7 [Desulfobacteraceae bacterium]
MSKHNMLNRRIKISGNLIFETAFHIGSGKEGELAAKMGILREADGRPILPGSTLKGNFRAFAERLSEYLGFTACLMDSSLSEKNCVSDENFRKTVVDEKSQKTVEKEFQALKTEDEKITWLSNNTCDICRLFGSPLQSSRIFFSDGTLTRWGQRIQIRDGVCIDRDTETARPGAKYDFEVVPAEAVFEVTIELENPNDRELPLIAAVLAEWESGFRLGGFTSRGLGRVKLTDKKVESVDYTDFDQLKSYLLTKQMAEAGSLLEDSLESMLRVEGESKHA